MHVTCIHVLRRGLYTGGNFKQKIGKEIGSSCQLLMSILIYIAEGFSGKRCHLGYKGNGDRSLCSIKI